MTGKDTLTPEVRRVETEVYETGVGGNRTDVTYEIGAVIDNRWVRFASVPEGAVAGRPEQEQDTGKSTDAAKAG
jgi:hypothetical protein